MTICGWISGIKKISISFLQGQWLSQDSVNVIFWRTYCYCKCGSVVTVGWIVVNGTVVVGGCGCSWRTTITTTRDVRENKKKKGENDEYMSHLVSDKWFRITLTKP